MLSNAFAFTSNDVSVAQMLADQKVINNHANDPLQYRLDATITRAELLKIALKIRTLEVPTSYTCQQYFIDVNAKQDWICSVVEMAADNDIITRENRTFRPQDTVTRAEALAILMKAEKIKIENDCGWYPCEWVSIDSSVEWQKNVFITALYKGIVSPQKLVQDFQAIPPSMQYTFKPQDIAKRSEVFAFANNVFNQQLYVNYPTETFSTGTLLPEQLVEVKSDAYIQWSGDAKILIVEYADLECPFCKRMHDDLTLQNIQKKYGDQLAYTFKHYPLPFHPLALPAAHTAECVAELRWSEGYYKFIDRVFSFDTPSETNIDTILTEMNLNNETVRACIRDEKFRKKIEGQINQGISFFSINGTPGNVIINTKTGNYEIVSGAQPEANFVEVVDRLLK